jgi:hypothetical protein
MVLPPDDQGAGVASQFSRAFLKSFEIHRVLQSVAKGSCEPVDLSAVVSKLKADGVAPSLSDDALATAVLEAAQQGHVTVVSKGHGG